MPDFPPGHLFGQNRFHVVKRVRGGLFHHHHGQMVLDQLPARSHAERELGVEFKSIDYNCFLPGQGESFSQYVKRRREELHREVELLAGYHGVTAHVPQVIDVVEGTNVWDPQVAACNLADGEPCIVLEQINARPLSELSDPIPQLEALELAEKLLLLLRVFHSSTAEAGDSRYFATLTLDDVAVDWNTRDCWFGDLWKLQTFKELKSRYLNCERELYGFVSPILVNLLNPRPRNVPDVQPGFKPADVDLYSLGVILYSLLRGKPDLSSHGPGFLGPAEIGRLEQQRGFSQDIARFLMGLANHSFHSAQKALDELCKIHRRKTHERFRPPNPPYAHLPDGFDSRELLEDGSLVSNRYLVLQNVFVGGQGCVYLAEDAHTRSSVVLKTIRYRKEDFETLRQDQSSGIRTWADFVRQRREEFFNEGRLALRVHERTASVPQLLDVVLINSPNPDVAADPDAQVNGPYEPVLVFEFIAGQQVSAAAFQEEEDVLELIRGICGIIGRFHESIDDRYYLYVDWKPANIMHHPESGNFTMVDLGAMLPVIHGDVRGQLFSTPLFAAPEEDVTPGRLRPSYDLHGLASVVWFLIVEPSVDEQENMLEEIEQRAARKQIPSRPVYDLSKVSGSKYRYLLPILEKALDPDPTRRYSSAEEMRTASLAALGSLSKLRPEKVPQLEASVQSNGNVKLSWRLPLDPFCRKIIICRGASPVRDYRTSIIHEEELTGTSLGATRDREDTVDPTWPEAHYAIFSVGHNGLVSSAVSCKVFIVADPEQVEVVNVDEEGLLIEEGLLVRWEVPDCVRLNGGEVVVERITGAPGRGTTTGEGVRRFHPSRRLGRQVIYEGLPDGICGRVLDKNLDPGQEYRYEVYSIDRDTCIRSQGKLLRGRPLPRLAHFQSNEAKPGNGQISIRFQFDRAAVDQVNFVRTHRPLDEEERRERLGKTRGGRTTEPVPREQFPPIQFRLDKQFRVAGLKANQDADLREAADGSLQLTWVDRTALAGVEYCYTPVLTYHDAPSPWLEDEVQAKAYGEVDDAVVESLPEAVRLRWSLPPRVDEVLVERLSATGSVAERWSPPVDQCSLMDRGLAADKAVKYLVRLRFGEIWSRGRDLEGVPSSSISVVPPLWASPADHGARFRHIELDTDEQVEIWDGDTNHLLPNVKSLRPWHRHDLQLAPWKPVSARLLSKAGAVIVQSNTVPFEEVAALEAEGLLDELRVRWEVPEGCRTVLVLLRGTRCARVVPASRGSVRFTRLRPGRYEVVVKTITELGDFSPGKTVGPVEVGEPLAAGREFGE